MFKGSKTISTQRKLYYLESQLLQYNLSSNLNIYGIYVVTVVFSLLMEVVGVGVN